MQSYDCKSKSYFQTASNVSFTKVPFISFLPDISALISSSETAIMILVICKRHHEQMNLWLIEMSNWTAKADVFKWTQTNKQTTDAKILLKSNFQANKFLA